MDGFKDLRIVDNFYQTSSYFPMPTTEIGTLDEKGNTNLGSYSLCFPYYIAGRDYYAMLLCCRNSSNTAKNILKKEMTTTELKKQYCNTTSGDGLYIDTYEEGRCIYKGTNPNNYITFNAETWRILSVENDGTLKIMRKDSIGNIAWDTTGGTYGSNQWSRPADLNTYLNNDYYNTLNSESQNLIQTHTWAVGAVISDNTDLAAQIASENGTTWSGNIGLISVSEYLRANTNTQQCGNFNLNNTNYSTCKTTNFIVPTSGYIWTISPRADYASRMFYVSSSGYVGYYSAGS